MRRSTLALVLLPIAIGLGLFLVKYRVQGLEAQLQNLNRDIVQDRQRLHVLRAEWSHFNEPDRLRALAGRHLDMMPVRSGQVVERDRMGEKLPERPENPSDQLAAESGNNAGKEFRP